MNNSYYIIEYTHPTLNGDVGTLHIARSQTTKFLERVAELRSLGFTVKTQLID